MKWPSFRKEKGLAFEIPKPDAYASPIDGSRLRHLQSLMDVGPNMDPQAHRSAVMDAVRKTLMEDLGVSDPDQVILRRGTRHLAKISLEKDPHKFLSDILHLNKKKRLSAANLLEFVEEAPIPAAKKGKSVPAEPTAVSINFLDGLDASSGRSGRPSASSSTIPLSKEKQQQLRFNHRYETKGEYAEPNNRARALRDTYSLLRQECGFHADADLSHLRLKPGVFWRLGFRRHGDEKTGAIRGNPALADNPYLALRMIGRKGGIRLTELFDFADADSADVALLRNRIQDCFKFRHGPDQGVSSILIKQPDGRYERRPIDSLGLTEAKGVLRLIQSELEQGKRLDQVSILRDVSGSQEDQGEAESAHPEEPTSAVEAVPSPEVSDSGLSTRFATWASNLKMPARRRQAAADSSAASDRPHVFKRMAKVAAGLAVLAGLAGLAGDHGSRAPVLTPSASPSRTSVARPVTASTAPSSTYLVQVAKTLKRSGKLNLGVSQPHAVAALLEGRLEKAHLVDGSGKLRTDALSKKILFMEADRVQQELDFATGRLLRSGYKFRKGKSAVVPLMREMGFDTRGAHELSMRISELMRKSGAPRETLRSQARFFRR